MLIKFTENLKPSALMYAPEAPKGPESPQAPEVQADSNDYSKIENRNKLYKKVEDVIAALKLKPDKRSQERAASLQSSLDHARKEEGYAAKGDIIEQPESIADRLSKRIQIILKRGDVMVMPEDKITSTPQKIEVAPKVVATEVPKPQPPITLLATSKSEIPMEVQNMAKSFSEGQMVGGMKAEKYYTSVVNGETKLWRVSIDKKNDQGGALLSWNRVDTISA